MASSVLATLAVVAVAAFHPHQKASDPLPIFGTLDAFELRDQDDRPVTAEHLRGSVQIIDFVFTTCPGICPMLTQQMAILERNTRDYGNRVHFVSISVDPENDSPQLLREYGDKHHINYARWSLLTGPLDKVEKVVVDGFKSAMGKQRVPASTEGAPDLMEVTHGQNFIVVDAAGRLRAYHPVNNEQDLQEIMRIVKRLVGTEETR
jgi:protein SCO1/2